jgi:hypothetical protein
MFWQTMATDLNDAAPQAVPITVERGPLLTPLPGEEAARGTLAA